MFCSSSGCTQTTKASRGRRRSHASSSMTYPSVESTPSKTAWRTEPSEPVFMTMMSTTEKTFCRSVLLPCSPNCPSHSDNAVLLLIDTSCRRLSRGVLRWLWRRWGLWRWGGWGLWRAWRIWQSCKMASNGTAGVPFPNLKSSVASTVPLLGSLLHATSSWLLHPFVSFFVQCGSHCYQSTQWLYSFDWLWADWIELNVLVPIFLGKWELSHFCPNCWNWNSTSSFLVHHTSTWLESLGARSCLWSTSLLSSSFSKSYSVFRETTIFLHNQPYPSLMFLIYWTLLFSLTVFYHSMNLLIPHFPAFSEILNVFKSMRLVEWNLVHAQVLHYTYYCQCWFTCKRKTTLCQSSTVHNSHLSIHSNPWPLLQRKKRTRPPGILSVLLQMHFQCISKTAID